MDVKEYKKHLKEVLEYYLWKLQEHAFKRKNAIKKIEDLQFPIAIHLVKIAVYPHHRDVNHWISEVLNWFTQIGTMKIKGQSVLKEKEYFDYLYIQPLTPIEAVEDAIKGVIDDYDVKPCVKDITQKAKKIDKELKELYKKLSKDFVNRGYEKRKWRRILNEYRQKFLEDCDG